MDYQHRIPLHLEQEDKFILNLTARQSLVIGSGCALGAGAISNFDFSTLHGFLFGSLVFVLIVALSCVVAFTRYHHRDLDQWALIVLVYLSKPHVYIRGRYYLDEREDEAKKTVEKDEEEPAW
jgi:hypothetical protein